jgi:hypothetical protein
MTSVLFEELLELALLPDFYNNFQKARQFLLMPAEPLRVIFIVRMLFQADTVLQTVTFARKFYYDYYRKDNKSTETITNECSPLLLIANSRTTGHQTKLL